MVSRLVVLPPLLANGTSHGTPFLQWYQKFTDVDDVIPISAKFGHGVDDIKEWILSKLPLGPAYYPKVLAWKIQKFPTASLNKS
jgi:GTPase Era involved in 16S rRNA processing